MTTGQGGKVHFNDAADRSRGVRLVQPVRSDQRILKPQRDRQARSVTGSAQRHPVAVDAHVRRPVYQVVSHSSPIPQTECQPTYRPPAAFCPVANSLPTSGKPPILTDVRGFRLDIASYYCLGAAPQMGDDAASRVSLYPLCSGRKSNPTRPSGHPPQQTPADPHAQLLRRVSHSRAPNRANTSAGFVPQTQSPAGVTLLRPS